MNQPVEYSYKDLDQLEYDANTLHFLRKKLDDFTIEVFRKIVNENKIHRGLIKARIDDFHSMRKRYDASFLVLESQGFIEKKEDGTATPYFVTIRGRQLGQLLKEEKLKREGL
ncbi:hypothetical protein [Neobacillus drentensis]|jgi:hypothetical protein|uniref:hypothetical protein n=1 Tax=Neobacillus drentensis TaxID=220684 RepID=UPI000BF34626|nr:hypothetical protein CN481_16285 [Bacillus sp. AFS006103]